MPGARKSIVLMACLLIAALLSPTKGQSGPQQKKGSGAGPSGTTLSVQVGWGGVVHPGRWNPIYITLSDPRPRNVFFEFRAPHGSYFGMQSHQLITIGPQAQTFLIYMPLRNFSDDDLAFTVRDASTKKRLANYPVGPYVSFGGADPVPAGYNFLGISGRRATLSTVIAALPGALIHAAHVDQAELPESHIGYDSLDVLILNAPEFTDLTDAQQQAIVRWVRAGGNLLLWPGDGPVPESAALVDALPCRIGTTRVITLSPAELKRAGLSTRFTRLPARELLPAADADPMTLLQTDQVRAYQRRVGLGRIIVSPIDLVSLQFNRPDNTWALWRPVLKPMIRRLPDDALATPDNKQPYYYGNMSETAQREATALRQVCDMLGDVPGAGRFGFGYVVGVLIGMMLVVGPVDWFVLKKLGRQPWTWATTAGWIALVTLSAVYVGHIFKSGELHWRTFELIDQADGTTVARTALAGLYSPRTTEYEVETDADAWWQPASPGDEFYGYRRSGQEIGFAQTFRGSRPDPMVVNVWNLRFLKGESTVPVPSLVTANLRVITSTDGAKPHKRLVGTITNTHDKPLRHVAARTRAGLARPFTTGSDSLVSTPLRIEPGATATIDALIDEATQVPAAQDASSWQVSRYPYYAGHIEKIDSTRLWDRGGDLSMRRTDRIEQWLIERDDLACVYAELEEPEPAAALESSQPVQTHWKVVRALVPLGT